MLLRTGIDLIEIDRFESAYKRHQDRLLSKIFTSKEIIETNQKIESLAARFAAKEAVSKALGTGIGNISWKEIEILRGQLLEPVLILHGKAKEVSQELGLETWAISLTHTRFFAMAFVVASGPSSK